MRLLSHAVMKIKERKLRRRKTADTSSSSFMATKSILIRKELKKAMTLQIRTIKSESVSQRS